MPPRHVGWGAQTACFSPSPSTSRPLGPQFHPPLAGLRTRLVVAPSLRLRNCHRRVPPGPRLSNQIATPPRKATPLPHQPPLVPPSTAPPCRAFPLHWLNFSLGPAPEPRSLPSLAGPRLAPRPLSGSGLPLSPQMPLGPAIVFGVQFSEVALFLCGAERSRGKEPASQVPAVLSFLGHSLLSQGGSSDVRSAISSASAAVSVSRSWSWTRDRGKGHPELR